MKFNPVTFANAAFITVVIVWLTCSLIVLLMPGLSMSAGGYMLHADLSGMQRSMHWGGFLLGMIIWAAIVWLAAWLFALIYNRLLSR